MEPEATDQEELRAGSSRAWGRWKGLDTKRNLPGGISWEASMGRAGRGPAVLSCRRGVPSVQLTDRRAFTPSGWHQLWPAAEPAEVPPAVTSVHLETALLGCFIASDLIYLDSEF